jgi:hypothetical protein
MAAKLTRLTHKTVIKLHLAAESCPFAVLTPGVQSGNFWIHPRMVVMKVTARKDHSLALALYYKDPNIPHPINFDFVRGESWSLYAMYPTDLEPKKHCHICQVLLHRILNSHLLCIPCIKCMK